MEKLPQKPQESVLERKVFIVGLAAAALLSGFLVSYSVRRSYNIDHLGYFGGFLSTGRPYSVLRQEIIDDRVADLFQKYDVNHDGRLSPVEYAPYIDKVWKETERLPPR